MFIEGGDLDKRVRILIAVLGNARFDGRVQSAVYTPRDSLEVLRGTVSDEDALAGREAVIAERDNRRGETATSRAQEN